MALIKETVVDQIEVREDGSLQVRRATYVVEDGVRIAGPIYHRIAYVPGTEVEHEAARVKTVASAVWTKEVVDEFNEKTGRANREQ